MILVVKNFNLSNALAFEMNIREYSTSISKKEKQQIQEMINYINQTENFKIAFTHRSCKNKEKDIKTYDRFEYLGDALLETYVSLFIFYSFPDYNEGQLTELRSKMVESKNLSELVLNIGLEEYLKSDKKIDFKNKSLSKNEKKILADIYESFIAVLFIEKGEKILHEFLFLTIFNRSETKNKIKRYRWELLNLKDKQIIFNENNVVVETNEANEEIYMLKIKEIIKIVKSNENKIAEIMKELLNNKQILDLTNFKEILKDSQNKNFLEKKFIEDTLNKSSDMLNSLVELNKMIKLNENNKIERTKIIFHSILILSRSFITSAIIIGISLIISRFI